MKLFVFIVCLLAASRVGQLLDSATRAYPDALPPLSGICASAFAGMFIGIMAAALMSRLK